MLEAPTNCSNCLGVAHEPLMLGAPTNCSNCLSIAHVLLMLRAPTNCAAMVLALHMNRWCWERQQTAAIVLALLMYCWCWERQQTVHQWSWRCTRTVDVGSANKLQQWSWRCTWTVDVGSSNKLCSNGLGVAHVLLMLRALINCAAMVLALHMYCWCWEHQQTVQQWSWRCTCTVDVESANKLCSNGIGGACTCTVDVGTARSGLVVNVDVWTLCRFRQNTFWTSRHGYVTLCLQNIWIVKASVRRWIKEILGISTLIMYKSFSKASKVKREYFYFKSF